MSLSMQLNRPDMQFVNRYSTWLLLWGIVLALLGAFAIGSAYFTTMLTIYLLGILLAIGGGILILDSMGLWWGKWTGFFLHFLMGLIYVIAGLFLIEQPLLGSIQITLILGIAYLVVGAFRTVYALTSKFIRWGWTLFNGLITLILGILILAAWPNSSLYILGLFVGIDLLICGWAYILIAIAAKSR